jgi:hypothetical protein
MVIFVPEAIGDVRARQFVAKMVLNGIYLPFMI